MESLGSWQWYDYLRLLTAVFAIWSMYRLSHLIRRRKTLGQNYSDRLKDFLWLIYAFLFVQTIGAIESVAVDGKYKYSIFLSLIMSMVAIRATRKSDDALII